jgi:hypothetical protein
MRPPRIVNHMLEWASSAVPTGSGPASTARVPVQRARVTTVSPSMARPSTS